MKLFEQPAHVLHDMLVNNEITSLELTEAILSRIDEVEGKIPTTYAFDKMEKLVIDGKTYTVKEILTSLVPLMNETVVVVTGKE